MPFFCWPYGNLAIAQAHNLPVLTLCKCCFGSLKQAEYHFKNDPDKQAMINWILQKEGLYYDGGVKVHHMLTLLDRERSIKTLSGKTLPIPLTG